MKLFTPAEAIEFNKVEWEMTNEQAQELHEIGWDLDEIEAWLDLDAYFESLKVEAVTEDLLMVNAYEYEIGEVYIAIRSHVKNDEEGNGVTVCFKDSRSYEDWKEMLKSLWHEGQVFYEFYGTIEDALDYHVEGDANVRITFTCSWDAFVEYIALQQ